jgi:hypothetical protein
MAPVAVSACEGECIVAVTNVFLGNYSVPIQTVLNDLVSYTAICFRHFSMLNRYRKAHQISAQLIPPQSRTSSPLKYLTPLVEAYNRGAYTGLETAIFPSYFHGKCQNKDGVDPAGCPKPDCPVVCGTPGSMVHFYPKLTSIVFEETSKRLVGLSSPESDSYKAVEKAVLADVQGGGQTRRYIRIGVPIIRRADDAQARLKQILAKMANLLLKVCGEGYAACSWEVAMKQYILSFP